MEQGSPGSLWKKVDYSLVSAPSESTTDGDARDQTKELREFWKSRRPVLDFIGTAFWAYAVLKVFIADLDTEVLGDVVGYRFFFFLAVAVLLVAVFRKPGRIFAAFLYVLAFPVVVICWKLPRLMYRSRSSVAFLAVVNAVSSLVGDIRYSVVATALAAFAALAIVALSVDVVLAIAGGLVLVLLGYVIWRTVKVSVVPSRFIRMHQRAITRTVESKFTRQLVSPNADLRRAEIEKFNQEQQNQFMQSLAMGVMAHRAMLFWAYQLELYRRSPASVFFNGLSYFWLIIRAVAALALVNLALYKADPAQFSFDERPSFIVFVRYVIAALYGGEIDALHARSDLAQGLSVVTSLVGLVVVGSLLLSSALSFRASRNESEIRETVDTIRQEGTRLDELLEQEYDVSVAEAIERLEQLRYGLMGVITFLSRRIPKDFEGPSARSAEDNQ